MKEVYLWKVDGRVVAHTSLEAAEQLDGLSRAPDKQTTEAEYSAAGNLARVINNKIVLGKTQAEKEDEAARKRIAEIDARFLEIEKKMVRPITAHIKGSQTQDDIDRINEYDIEAQALRTERTEKVASLITPL